MGLHWLEALHGTLQVCGNVMDNVLLRVRCWGEKLYWKPEGGATNKLSRGVVQVCIQRDLDTKKGECPVFSLGQGCQGCLELAVEMLNHTIGLRVVTGSPVAADTKKSHDLVPHFGLELTAMVRGEAERHTKP